MHYIWQVHCFDMSDLRTTDGKSIEIQSFGIYNRNAGPDFLNGKIKIGDTIWAGHIEMHLRSSDWRRHKHGADARYNNVILHVVFLEDERIKLQDGTLLPCLTLDNRIDPALVKRYEGLINNRTWIPCQAHIDTVSKIVKTSTIQRMMAERMEEKALVLKQELDELEGDLSMLIYRQLAWGLGLSVNGDAMRQLVTSLPYKIIQRHRDDLFQVEALLFGQAGMLEEPGEDEYRVSLRREYKILSRKFSLRPMPSTQWKYLRLRPAAFPTIRIAQLAQILHRVSRLDDVLLSGSKVGILKALDVKAEGYWKYQYTWGTPSTPRAKSLGRAKRDIILINVVAPLLWLIGIRKDQRAMKDKALSILEGIGSEKNSIIARWRQLGYEAENAAESQGLLQLKKTKCDQQRCLECPIGHQILSRG